MFNRIGFSTLPRFALTALLAIPCLAAVPDGPDMTKVRDVLGGQRYLLRNDDIMSVVQTYSNGQFSTQVVQYPVSYSAFVPIYNTDRYEENAILSYGHSGRDYVAQKGAGIGVNHGRVYNSINDVVGILEPEIWESQDTWLFHVADLHTFEESNGNRAYPLNTQVPLQGSVTAQVLTGDFNGDGYAEFLLVYSSYLGLLEQPSITWIGMTVAAATDVNTVDSSIKFGPEFVQQPDPNAGLPGVGIRSPGQIAVADFDGDGRAEIAAFLQDSNLIQFFSVDPNTFQITPTVRIQMPFELSNPYLLAGHFRGLANSELVAIGQVPNTNTVQVFSIATINVQTGSFSPSLARSTAITSYSSVYNVLAAVAPLNGSYSNEQLIYLVNSNTDDGASIAYGSFDSTFAFTPAVSGTGSSVTASSKGCAYSFSLGNFDNHDAKGNRIPNLEISTFVAPGKSCDSTDKVDAQLTIWTADLTQKNNWLPTVSSQIKYEVGSDVSLAFMQAGDLTGLALRLGEPEIVTINGQFQPDVVLGMPPMHVDWIAPQQVLEGCPEPNEPCLLNLTYLPTVSAPAKAFQTQFNFGTSSTQTLGRKSTTSWSVAVKETTQASASFSIPAEESYSVNIKNSAQYAHDQTVSKSFNTYAGASEQVQSKTGTADYVFFTKRSHNVYYYPVIGQSVCQSGGNNCQPLYVVFSIPDQVTYSDQDGSTLDWYQPIQEPGNVFSYPSDFTQLATEFGSQMQTLAQSDCQATDTSTNVLSSAWTNGQTQGSTQASTNSFSDELSISASESAGISGVFGAKESFSLDLKTSTSLYSLNVASQQLSESTGVVIEKPTFASPYYYSFANSIFGLQSPQTPLQSLSLQADIKSSGPLFIGFAADPIPGTNGGMSCSSGQSSWWQQVYTLPDVAVNHPARWKWSKSTKTVQISPQNSADPILSDFYMMKGLFVTSQVNSGEVPLSQVNSPSLLSATAGDQLSLIARVYNFSLVDTNAVDPSATVHVRFYGQRYCSSISQDGCSQVGLVKPFLIGETTIAMIPAFKSLDANRQIQANWRFASVPFDTSNLSGQDLVFWVVVWLQNSNSQLSAELPGHGLQSLPSSSPYASISDIPVEDYSNNVGLYGANTQFYVAPKNTATTNNKLETTQRVTSHLVSVASEAAIPVTPLNVSLSLPSSQLLLDEKSAVTTQLTSGTENIGRITLSFYEGDPKQGGQRFNLQTISHLDANSSRTHYARYQPQSCGPHTIYVEADARGIPTVTSHVETNVVVDSDAVLNSLIQATGKLAIDQNIKDQMIGFLSNAKLAYDKNDSNSALNFLLSYQQQIVRLQNKVIPVDVAVGLLQQAKLITGCGSMAGLQPKQE